jgi:membrane protease YdiL (CAAX protease family)
MFGIGHLGGYPPGLLGALLATLYGVALGLLRHFSKGIGAAVVAHVFADATIFGIVAYAARES